MDIVLDAMEGPGESSRSPGGRNGGWFGETENVRGCERVKGRWKEAGKRDSGKGKRKYEGRWDRSRENSSSWRFSSVDRHHPA